MALTKLPGYTLDTTKNFTFANANVTGNINTGNANLGNAATANFFIGNGSLLTGLAAGYANSNVASYLPTYAGNITFANAAATGNIIPTANVMYSLGNATNMWKDVYVGPGSLYVNGVKVLEQVSTTMIFSADINQNIRINTSGTGDIELLPAGTGKIAVKGALQIQSNVNVTTNDGNAVGFSVPILVDSITSKTANSDLILTAAGTGSVKVSDDFVVTGNLTVQGVASILSVTSLSVEDNIIDISAETTGAPSNNAGIRVVRGDEAAVQIRWNETTDTWQFTNDGSVYSNLSAGSTYANSNVASYLPTYTGNLTAGNANLGNLATANFFAGSGNNLSNLQASNITGTVANATYAATAGSTSSVTGANVSGEVSFASTANAVAGANVSGQVANALVAGTVYTNAQPNITSIGSLTGLIVSGDTTVTGNLTVTGTTYTVSSNNIAFTDSILEIHTQANLAPLTVDDGKDIGIRAHYFKTTDKHAFFGVANDSLSFEYYVEGTETAGVFVGTYGNLKGAAFISTVTTGTAPFVINSTTQVANLNAATSGTAATVTTAAQPNITSTGTLSSLAVTGNITSGNANLGNLVTANFFSGSGNLLSNIQGASVSGAVGLATYATTANAVAGANVSGEVSFAATANAVAGANVSGAVGSATTAGTVTTAAQPNITSVGTLTSVTVTDNVTAGNVKTDNLLYANGVAWAMGGAGGSPGGSNTYVQFNDAGSFNGTANLVFNKTSNTLTVDNIVANGSGLTSITGANVSGEVAFATTANAVAGANVSGEVAFAATANAVAGANISGAVSSATTAGTVTTAAQPNITSTGTLTGLISTGVIDFIGASNVSLGTVANVRITGGTTGQVLSTDGTGTLSWATSSGGGGGATLEIDNATNANFFPALSSTSSGSLTTATVSTTKLYFNPSTGTLNATIFNSLSDETKKTNIETITDALGKVRQLSGVTYSFIDSNEPSAGLIAQQVEKVLPESVKYNKELESYSLNYNGVTGLLVEAIKILATENDQLTTIVEALSTRLTELEKNAKL